MKTGEKMAGVDKLSKAIFDEFEKMFVEGDGLAMTFDKLAGTDVLVILLDCLM